MKFLLLLHAGVLCYVSLASGERESGGMQIMDSPFSHNGLICVFCRVQLRTGVKYLPYLVPETLCRVLTEHVFVLLYRAGV
jgi:hypothetical protein